MTDVVKFLTFKQWLGGASERFKHTDMNRIRYNTEVMADFIGQTYDGGTVQHKDIFDYRDQNTLEQAIKDICLHFGIDAPMDTVWNYGHSVSYVDFERLEKNLYDAYVLARGEGNRILWDQSRRYDPYTLYADNWTGIGPFYYDLPTDLGTAYADGLAFVSPTASVLQRASEYNAMITVESSTEGVRLCANGIKPKMDIPIVISRGMPRMTETATLQASSWSGTGPWTQSIVFTNTVSTGVITINEGATSAQAEAMAKAGISVASVSGRTVTVRANLAKPTINIPIMLVYDSAEGQ